MKGFFKFLAIIFTVIYIAYILLITTYPVLLLFIIPVSTGYVICLLGIFLLKSIFTN